MDFTPELSTFQGVIISADNVYTFSRLTARGGNEEKLQTISETIQKYFNEQNFTCSEGIVNTAIPKIRKFTFYLILNSDFPILQQMVDMEGIDTVIWTIPTIPKCLLCELIWNLNMDMFLYESIVFTHPNLGLELMGAFTDHFKYFSPVDIVDKLKYFIPACYEQLGRLLCFKLDHNNMVRKLNTAFASYQKCLKFFADPPNAYKLNALNNDDLYRYKGDRFLKFLSCAYDCLEQFTNKIVDYPNKSEDIYSLTYKEDDFNKEALDLKLCDSPIKDISMYLNYYNKVLLDTLKTLVMDVSVDIFCAWSEFQEKGKSLQQAIGELCYQLLNKISEIPSLSSHQVLGMLQQISRKPIHIKDIINVTDTNTIVENINKNDENKESWLIALLDKQDLCNDLNLINVVDSNLSVYNQENSYILFKIIQKHLSTLSSNQNGFKMLAVKVFQQCDLSDKYKILDELFRENCFSNVYETTNLQNMVTEIFNKLIASTESHVDDVLGVFLQNPFEVYKKICSMAIQNTQQCEIMLKVSLLLQTYSSHFYRNEIEPCVINVTRNMLENDLDTDKKQVHAIKFVLGLKNRNIIPGTKLLLLIIMPTLHKALINKNINGISTQVKLLKETYTIDELVTYRAPMLAMLAQVLDVVRWKVHTFTPKSPKALEDALYLQMSIIQTYGDNIPEKEKIWLKNKMINLQPINMYYYRLLWKPPGRNFLEIISGKTISSDVTKTEIRSWLTQVICSISQQEWCYVWESLDSLHSGAVLEIFHDSLSVVTLAEAANRTDNSWLCIQYSYRCFVYIARYKFFREPLTARRVLSFAHKISVTAKVVSEINAEGIGNILLPLLAYIAERKEDHSVDLATFLEDSVRDTHLAFIIKLISPRGRV